jgi:hypothetical protein
MDCAFHQGGLLMDDETGSVSVFCDAHFKPILFCTCKEVYNESKPMVFCDECCDWYHNSCEGITKPPREDESYTCRSCREMKKQGRSVSKVLVEKNKAKELRSSFQQNASKAIGLLAELEGGLCPIMDDITKQGKSQYSIQEINDAKDVLSAPPFAADPAADANTIDLLAKLGVRPVIDQWRAQLNLYLDRYELWFNRANQFFNEQCSRIVALFGPNQLGTVREVLTQLHALCGEASAELVGTPVDLEGFHVYVEAVAWMAEFLQVRLCADILFPILCVSVVVHGVPGV